jgi:hypothetical protein
MQRLLNQALYQRLCARFGRDNVGVNKPGVPGAFGKGVFAPTDKSYRLIKLDPTKAVSASGEEFNIACPFCGERRSGKTGRLYINHLWGTKDPYTDSTILWLMHCYNEECHRNFANRKSLADMIVDGDETFVVAKTDYKPPPPKDAKLPEGVQSLRYLAERDTRHPAVKFCLRRGYDPRELSDVYNVMYCTATGNQNSRAANRLVVPFYTTVDGQAKLAGWTARRLEEPPKNVPQDELDAILERIGPKWRHSSNPTGHIVYGLEEASKYPVIVLGEGPGDRWSIGPRSVAVLGKTLSMAKAHRIVTAMAPHGKDARIVVALDPSQDKKARLRKAQHHIHAAVKVLKSITQIPVYDLWLPMWADPGSLSRSYFWWHVIERLKQRAA